MSKLLCAALLTLAIGCKDKAADAPKSTEPTAPAPDPSPAARKAEAPKLPEQAGSGSAGPGSGSATPVVVESKQDPDKLDRHKGGVVRGKFPVDQAYENLKKQRQAAPK